MREIPCPYCRGEVLSEQNGRVQSSATLFPRMQNILNAISNLLSLLLGGPKTVGRKEALGGKCRTCGDTGVIKDVTDTSEQDQAAGRYLEGKAQRIVELERKLGNSPGGNMISRIAGVKIDIVGRTLNTAKSYTVHEGKGAYRSRGKVTSQGRGALPEGPEKDKGANVITGNNPPANTGGGLYYIQCGNKFKLVAGAQGIEISSNGPINIDGGMVRFTGAETSIGSGKGPVIVQGDALTLQGNKSCHLTCASEDGCVTIGTSVAITGNLQAGGGYVDNLYAANMTMPEKQETTKISSQTDLLGGPAVWGGLVPRLQPKAVQNLVKWVTDSVFDPVLSKSMNPLNPRSILKTKDNVTSVIYSALPHEAPPTGVMYGVMPGPAIMPLFNFPHEHSMPDEAHSHNLTMPAINYKGHTAESVRGEADASGINSRIPASAAGAKGDPFQKLVSIGQAAVGVYNAVTGGYEVA